MEVLYEWIIIDVIKTKYANQIFDGTKKFEFRRKSIGNKNCNKKIYIYSSEKDKAIIGYMIVDKIFEGNLDYILNVTNYLNDEDMIDYFKGCDICYALHIIEYHKFLIPIKLKDIKLNYPKFVMPQFYRYIKAKEPIYKELESRSIRWESIIWKQKQRR